MKTPIVPITWTFTLAPPYNYAMNPKRTVKYFCIKFTRLQGNPHSLAIGTAIGTFLGIVPITPFHTIAVIAATFVTRTSTIAGYLATLLTCNPLTYIPQYYLSIVIGNILTPYNFTWEKMQEVLDLLFAKPSFKESVQALSGIGSEAVIVLLVGGAALAFPFTIASYFLSLRLFIRIKRKRREKHILAPGKVL